ncbi:NAD(P)H-binding protein [Sphingobacteriaceae bacterium WQ 2009]|uniref:NAD(P)H-binding protein n=1 Tax=Rhinopithecimicrobium faecis TaxID=2820698 RepID=A0A8T4HB98_9SPHI|nr:NAD(P)H-binding protein [Sphingobacteriaceae bacterium WQ 2009]
MKIAIIGISGFVGKTITKELVERNHQVLGICRQNILSDTQNLTYRSLDVNQTDQLAKELAEYDVVVSAFSAGWNQENMHLKFVDGSTSILKAVKLAKVKRFIVIGGAGTLYVNELIQAVDTPEFPEAFKAVALAAREYYQILKREEDLNWLYFSPAFEIHPGITTGRTGNYRHRMNHPIFDENGKSTLSVEDLAVAIADEIEAPKYSQTIFTAAY